MNSSVYIHLLCLLPLPFNAILMINHQPRPQETRHCVRTISISLRGLCCVRESVIGQSCIDTSADIIAVTVVVAFCFAANVAIRLAVM